MKKLLILTLLLITIDASAQNSVEVLFIKKINEFRAKNSLDPVKYSSVLDSAAEFHSTYMKQTGKVEHYQRGYAVPKSRVEKFDTDKQFQNCIIGENVLQFCVYGDTLTDQAIADQCFKQWFDSPPHRQTMLMKDAKLIGFGSVIDPREQPPFPKKFNYGWCTMIVSGPQIQTVIID